MMSKKILKNKKFGYLVIFIILVVLVYFLGNKIDYQRVVLVIQGTGFWAPLVFVLLMASTFIFAPLSGTPIFFAGYVVFGRNVQYLSYLATILAAVCNFWIARKWGRALVVKFVGAKNINKIDEFTKVYGVKSLLLLRIFQGHLHDFISYAYGLTKINFWTYLIVTIFSPIPWLLVWQLYIWNQVSNLSELTVWFFGSLIPVFAISAFYVAWYKKKKAKLAK